MRLRRLTAVFGTVVAIGTVSAVGFTGIASAHDDDFRANMNGANERPGPADPDGTAKAKVEIDVAKGEVCFKFDWKNIASPTMGHIHQGPAGVAGPIVVHLLDNFSLDRLEADDDIKGCVNADPGLLGDIVAHPDQYYVNLHNTRFPAVQFGASSRRAERVRGQRGIGPAPQQICRTRAR